MKKTLLLCMGFAVYGLQAQVGVNTTDPKAMLDVKGDVRIQESATTDLPSHSQCPCFLVVDKQGKVKRVPMTQGTGSGSGTSGGGGTTVIGGGASAIDGGVTNEEVFDPVVYDIRWNLYKTMEVKIKLPLNLPPGVPYSAYMSPEVALPMVDGTTRNFRLTYPQGTTNRQPIEATLLISGDKKYVPKLILEGNPAENYDLDLFFNGVEQDAKLTLRIDTNAVQNTEHGKVFTYPVIKIEDQGIFALPLGAKYAEEATNTPEVLKEYMYLETHPEKYKAYKMYGSTFQWQRKADGHELVEWSLSSSGSNAEGTPVNGTTSVQSNSWTNAGTNDFIYESNYSAWVTNSVANAGPHNLWEEGGSNTPCPTGYSVPTIQKIQSFVNKYNEVYKDRVEYVGLPSKRKLWYLYSANRYSDSSFSISDYFWSSEYLYSNSGRSFNISFTSPGSSSPYRVSTSSNYQVQGHSIICTKN